MPDAAAPVLEARGLSKVFTSGPNPLTIFSGLDLALAPGEQLALIGESGAGKSTLLYLLAGLDRPTSGTIRYRNASYESMDEAALARFRNREIGFVWQHHYLLPEFTALENVMMPLLIGGQERSTAMRTAGERLEAVGLAKRGHHRAGELSGGEQQRVSLARALAASPSLLLADEPTGNLDFRTGETIFGLLREIHQALGLTSVLVTHNVSFARRCDRILKLEAGQFAPFGPVGLE